MKKVLLTSGILLGFLIFNPGVLADDVETTATSESETVSSTINEEEVLSSSEINEVVESSETKENEPVKDEVETVKAAVEAISNEKVGEDVPIGQLPSASEIRKQLSDPVYNVSKEKLDNYTDKQLEDAMTLFERYNHDIIGMDYGRYAMLLNTLYEDKTVNVDAALAQLSFNPSSFGSFSEMIPQVTQLQTYLKTLYPTNSTFFKGIERTDDQLVTKLQELQKMEDELTASSQSLFGGRIIYLINANDYEEEEETTTTQTNTTETTTSASKDKEGVPVSSSDTKKKDGSLPQTGENKSNIVLPIIGGIALVALIIIFVKRSKKNN